MTLGVSVVSSIPLGGGSYPFLFCLFVFSRKIVLRRVWAQSQQYSHIWHQLHIWGIPKTTLRLDDLLEGLTELAESGCYRYDSHREGCRWETAKERCTQGGVQRSTKHSSHCLLCMKSGHVTFLVLMCENMHRVLPIREAHRSLWCSEAFPGLMACSLQGCLLVISPSQRSG